MNLRVLHHFITHEPKLLGAETSSKGFDTHVSEAR